MTIKIKSDDLNRYTFSLLNIEEKVYLFNLAHFSLYLPRSQTLSKQKLTLSPVEMSQFQPFFISQNPVFISGSRFSRETGCREAALILLKEKTGRYSVVREPLLLDRCVICWDREWDDCFEVTEFTTKESYIFKVSFALKFMDVHK